MTTVRNTRIAYRKGVKDWLLQRASAVILLIYIVLLAIKVLMAQPLDFVAWQAIFVPLWFKIATLFAALSISVHAWIGVWTIFTDYVNQAFVRFMLMAISLIALISYFIWSIQILWGIN